MDKNGPLMNKFWGLIRSRMGADQSSTGNVTLRSQRDEDIPYTSYSISKPIDGGRRASLNAEDTPKASPRIAKSKSPVLRDVSRSSSVKHDIVVVKEGVTTAQPDKELVKLDKIPVVFPITLKTATNPSSAQNGESMEKLEVTPVMQLCSRYQEHLKQCAEAVAFDQNALCVRIKEVDYTIQTLYNQLTERQKKFAKYAEQCNKINEMHSALNKIRMNVEQTTALMERLNNVLPPEYQLEPFSMQEKGTIN